MMGESRLIVDELLVLCLQRIKMEENIMTTEQDLVEVVKSFERVRKRWLQAELELKKFKELLVKSDVAKAALEVKLKHARNQLDVEMKKRYKVEGDYQYLRQMQLMCDILVHDSKSSACLNDEQKSLLATFDHRGANVTLQRSSKRLSVIDESSFLSVCHSDISYDRTDDDVDLDTSVIKPLRSRARERRRSSMGTVAGAAAGRRGRGGNVSAEPPEKKTVDKEVENIIMAAVLTPDGRGQVTAPGAIPRRSPETAAAGESEPVGTGSSPQHRTDPTCETMMSSDQTSVWLHCDDTEAELQEEKRADRNLRHVFLSKTVIRPETCSPCGKRIRFGKMAVKCRKCRAVAHPECKHKLTDGCSAGGAEQQISLEGLAPAAHPRVPQLLVECVAEIERRGLEERGLYRVPGGERLVKELRERVHQGKTPLLLSKVHDIHVVCGLLKDSLRRLKEPLVTFRLHRTFMEASEMADEDSSTALVYQAIAELPKANRDTLAFLLLHLHKVMRSPQCQMDQKNLARVFGPTVVGHGMSEPSPTTIMRDTNTQPKVMCRLLSLPETFWKSVLAQTDPIPAYGQDGGHGRLFKPLTSPELNSYHQGGSRASLRGRIRNLGQALTSNGRVEPGRRFFTSPS